MTVLHSAFEFLEELSDTRIESLKAKAKQRIEKEKESNVYDDIYNDSDEEEEMKRMGTELIVRTKNYSQIVKEDSFNYLNDSKFSKNESFIEHDDVEMICQDLIESKNRSF
jgi:hypothetical protein